VQGDGVEVAISVEKQVPELCRAQAPRVAQDRIEDRFELAGRTRYDL
jgi:hypothetical protein